MSNNEVYIGNVNSDDFETASFDVIFNRQSSSFSANVEYRDFDNQIISKAVNLDIKVYTQEEALQLGLIKKSYTVFYVLIIVLVVVIWLVYKRIQKVRRLRKSKEAK